MVVGATVMEPPLAANTSTGETGKGVKSYSV